MYKKEAYTLEKENNHYLVDPTASGDFSFLFSFLFSLINILFYFTNTHFTTTGVVLQTAFLFIFFCLLVDQVCDPFPPNLQTIITPKLPELGT